MRILPTSRRLAVCGLTALAGLLLLASAGRAMADEGVARVTDQKTGVVGASHSEPCVIEATPQRVSSHGRACGPGCQCGSNCHCSGAPGAGCCNDQSAGCTSGRCGKNSSACGNGLCGKGAGRCNGSCGNGSACACGNGCECGGCGKGLGKLFGGKSSKNCRCGSNCQCSQKGGLCGLGRCNPCCDLNGDGYADPIGNGVCHGCGAHGALFGHGYCGGCCGGVGGCLPGVPCLGAGLGIPCLGAGCFGGPGGCLGMLAGAGTRPRGALGGHYSRVYAVNPYYHDFRDGAVYAAQGYNAPIAVPLAPNVDYQFNYGWGMPSSRITPISRVVPSPYAVQPQYTVPYGYVPAGATPSDVTTDSSTDANAEEASR